MKVWLGILTAVVAILAAGLIVGLATLNTDIQRLDAQLSTLSDATGDASTSALDPMATATPTLEAQVASAWATSSTFAITLTVRFPGPADLLADPPLLRGSGGKTYQATADSLSQARFAFLDLVSRGSATATLVFRGAPNAQESLTLIFNPGHRATDIIAPRREVLVR